MPHNLFLHSGVVHWHRSQVPRPQVRLRRVTAGCVAALSAALLINAAILVVTAATSKGGAAPATLEAADPALSPILGKCARLAFGLGLLAAGVAATITSGVAGDFTLVGLTSVRAPVLARRAVGVIPASIAVALGMGEVTALVLSQVVLGFLLPGIAFVLVWLTSDPRVMGTLANGRGTRRIGYLLCALLAVASMLALVPAGVL